MGIIGRLFGTDEAIKSGIDAISSGLDSLVYTDQEKSQDHARAVTEARTMLVNWMEASQGQKLSRRIIALSITAVFLFEHLMSMAFGIASVWADKPERLEATAKLIGDNASMMQGAMMLILGFYFAAPHLSDIIKPAMERFGKKNG